ncbi:hypothetical protein BURK1_02449 [Burkholderiales bacterium]|nr:hypothetical protein BURK1_02449 [Burkholderiales bacterium]
MPAPESAADPQTAELAQRAASLDARGAFAEAVEAWSRTVERAPTFLPAQLGLAQAQIRAGMPADAVRVLERVTAHAPGMPAAWLALGVAHSMLGRHDTAVAAAERAAALAPGVAALQTGLGDVLRQADRLEDAARAYRSAVEAAPDDVDALNKLATTERTMRKLDAAEALLRRAHALAPRHPYARVNLGTLELERGRVDAGAALLRDALGDARLPADAREEASGALAMLAERSAMAGPIEEALAGDDPAPIAGAIRSLGRSQAVDRRLLADFARIAERHAGEPSADHRFASGAPVSAAWSALEAHHNFRLPRTSGAIAASVALVARADRAGSPEEIDVVRYARAVADARQGPPDEGDPVAFEAWLRWRHAQIAGHRPRTGPGQFKIINNVVRNARNVPRTPPARLRATLERMLADLAPRMPPGAWRIACVYMAVLEMHPFADANGRVMRLALNRLLIHAGLFPHLRPQGSDNRIIAAARVSGELEPLIEWLAAGSRYAAELDREWAARESR